LTDIKRLPNRSTHRHPAPQLSFGPLAVMFTEND
jgi:hypothetical protein